MHDILKKTKKQKFKVKSCIFPIHMLGNCDSIEIPGRVECGWPNITKEQCLARDCCFKSTSDNNGSDRKIKCFIKPQLGE